MSKLEKEVNELIKKYEEMFRFGVDPFECFMGYDKRSELENEKKWLEISLKEGIPLFDLEGTDIFVKYI